MKDLYDKIAAASPVNRQAALSTSKGVSFAPAREFTEKTWLTPPRMMPHYPDEAHPDLTGRVVGRLTVIGLMAQYRRLDSLWVCRCVCGRYVGRRGKGLRREGAYLMCQECSYTQSMRKGTLGSGAAAREAARNFLDDADKQADK